MSNKFSVTITVKVRHGKLWELRRKFGTSTALAKYLEMSPSDLGRWLNLKALPPKGMSKERKDRLDKKLVSLGYLFEDLFPPELTEDMLDRPKEFEVEREVDLKLLGESGGIKLIDAPDKKLEESELRQKVIDSLETLTPREEKIIKYRFGLDGEDEHTLRECGDHFEVGPERIRQIEAHALRKLRHPSRSRKLKGFLEGEEQIHYVTAKYNERYKKQKDIVFVNQSSIMGVVYSISVSSLIEMFNGFEQSGTYIRLLINGILEWAYRIDKKDVGVHDYFNRHQTLYREIPRVIKVQKNYLVSVIVGPIVPECVKFRQLIKNIEIVLTYAPIGK